MYICIVRYLCMYLGTLQCTYIHIITSSMVTALLLKGTTIYTLGPNSFSTREIMTRRLWELPCMAQKMKWSSTVVLFYYQEFFMSSSFVNSTLEPMTLKGFGRVISEN